MGPAAQSSGNDAGGGVIALAALLLATAFPSTSRTSWMRPESFHLVVGMNRLEAEQALAKIGWKTKKGDDAEHMVIDYADDKAVTLQFHKDRLWSIRFELFTFLPDAKTAFAEQKAFLRETFGEPKPGKNSKSVLLYDGILPNIMVVVADDPKSANGQQGLGILVVRYFDPAPPR